MSRMTFQAMRPRLPSSMDKDPLDWDDGVRDQANMPAAADPGRVRHDLRDLAASKAEHRQP
jgi:hypothetical protein